MSNSYKHNPITSFTTAKSEKKDKKIANRKLRHKIKDLLYHGEEDLFPVIREVSNVWNFAKDGKCQFFGRQEDIKEFKVLRK